MKKLLSLTLALSFLLAFNSCGSKDAKQTSNSNDSLSKTETKPKETTKANWIYSEEVDKMGSKKYFAENHSNEDLGLGFPYENSTASLLIRNDGKQNEFIFMVTKGQILSDIIDGGTVRLKFDDEAPINANFNNPADHSSEIIFLRNPQKYIDKLKTSKKMVIEVGFYDNGNKQIEFNTENFKWEH